MSLFKQGNPFMKHSFSLFLLHSTRSKRIKEFSLINLKLFDLQRSIIRSYDYSWTQKPRITRKNSYFEPKLASFQPILLVLLFTVWDFFRNVTPANSEGNPMETCTMAWSWFVWFLEIFVNLNLCIWELSFVSV